MKKTLVAVICCLGAGSQIFADDTNILNNEQARASYAIGMMLGQNWKRQSIDVDPDLVLRGLKDEQSGGKTLLTSDEMQSTLRAFQQTIMAKQMKEREELAAKDKAAGEAFLATNKNNPGVITLTNGLQYLVLTNGDGEIPDADSTVTVNYRGRLLDGTEFDSSAKVGHPIEIQANRVIRGWTEALTMMKVGSTWRLFIPEDLAYGERGSRSIPPNSTLIFDVQLLSAKATPPPPAMPPTQPLTSDIIKVPSAEEMKKGAKIETIKAEDVQKIQSQTQSNAPSH